MCSNPSSFKEYSDADSLAARLQPWIGLESLIGQLRLRLGPSLAKPCLKICLNVYLFFGSSGCEFWCCPGVYILH